MYCFFFVNFKKWYALAFHLAVALKCHVCNNVDVPECFELTADFQQECHRNETQCALQLNLQFKDVIDRMCVKANFECPSPYKCKLCSTDGCNTGTKVEDEQKFVIPDVDEVNELLKANLYGISIIGFVLFVFIIWCVVRMKSKRDDNLSDYDENEEYYNDDCEEVYENEV